MLYEKYIDEIYKFVFLKTSNKELTEDIVSETFIAALQNVKTFSTKSGSNVRAWLYKIAYNKIIDSYKKKEKHPQQSIEDFYDLGYETYFSQEIDNKDRLKSIQAFLGNCSKNEREVVLYRIWFDLSFEEIAEITELSLANCRKIASRTLKKIQAHFVFILLLLLV